MKMDREKVIKGLECCCEHIKGMNCDHCPYDEEQIEIGQINQCTSALAYDALALLKEQKPEEEKIPEYPCKNCCSPSERAACCGCEKERQWQTKYGKQKGR